MSSFIPCRWVADDEGVQLGLKREHRVRLEKSISRSEDRWPVEVFRKTM